MKSFLSRALLVCTLAALLGLCSAQVDHGHHHHRHSADSLIGTEAEYERAFVHFIKQHEKNYTEDEFFPRYNIFKSNYQLIAAHNAKPNETFTMAVNEFADLTADEFREKMTSSIPFEKKTGNASHGLKQHHHVKAPTSLDWRTVGAVTYVRNQGATCGSGYAFSAIGALEGAVQIKTGILLLLSPQQLVDCSWLEGNQGCSGGTMDYSFQYMIDNGGVGAESANPYTGNAGVCHTGYNKVVTISAFNDVTSGSESDLMAAVNIGPVSVAVDANPTYWQFYSSGIITATDCGNALNHGVLLVGYGTDAATSTDYFIVKNSWGTSWGESGYIRLVRGQDECGIADFASYPIY